MSTIRTARKKPPDTFAAIVLGKVPVGGLDAAEAVRKGYPANVLKELSVYFDVADGRIHRVTHISASTAGRLLKQNSTVDLAVSEKVLRIGNVTRLAIEVFDGDEEAAKDWLREPNLSLRDSAPLDLLDTEPGAATVRQILNAIASGGAV